MRTEIERKFVLSDPPAWLGDHPSEAIEQGYVVLGDGVEVRLRRSGNVLGLTIKTGTGLVRGETEIELTPEQFEALWQLTEGRRIRKRRYRRAVNEGTFEIDVYEGALEGMVIAEMEFETEGASRRFEAPAWLGAEVTGDDRFANRSLATEGRIPAIGG